MLDAIRATLGSGDYLGIPNTGEARAALYGYSGGAQATGWAAQLYSTYAPELNIIGMCMQAYHQHINAGIVISTSEMYIS